MMSKKAALASAAVAVLSLGFAGAANATNYNITLVANGDGTFSSEPWGNHVTTSTFTDVATFTVGAPSSTDATLTTILLNGLANVTFTSVLLDGATLFSLSASGDGVDHATLTPIDIAAGVHTITINGALVGGGGTYAGVLNTGPQVPEPATWIMMILGMGMVGAGLRMRRRTKAAASAA
jgi:hypothetical protein